MPEARARLQDLPKTITWRRAVASGPGRFEVLYDDGADLDVAARRVFGRCRINRDEFFAGTEPADVAAR